MASASVDQIRTHADKYREYIKENLAKLPVASSVRDILAARTAEDAEPDREITVCLRTRPLLPHELEKDEFTSVAVRNPDTYLFKPEFKWTGPVMSTQKFAADFSFGPEDDNAVVYEATAKKVIPLVLGGGVGQLYAYGQTGSGKTYTMTSLE
ncbi:P-loop containing nucleoside triphosphate hydrolase protein, partial [Jimgerdemannia flammicorona]